MANRIRGITVEIGGDTTKLDKALNGVNDELSETKRSLKDVERLLKLDPKNTVLLEQKQRLLSKAVEDTSSKLSTLREAAKTADAALARGTAYEEKYAPLKAAIEQTSGELAKLTKKAESVEASFQSGDLPEEKYQDFQRTLEETGKKLEALKEEKKALDKEFEGAKLDQSQYDALQRELIQTEKDFEKAKEEAKRFNSTLDRLESALETASDKAGRISKTFQPVSTAVAGIATAALASVPATDRLRAGLGNIETNAQNAAISMETASEAMKIMNSVSGDLDGSIEATNNLLNSGLTESNLQQAVENLAGAYIRFPETLKFESLADSLQETLATGSATGQFAELLERLGVDVDYFNEKMALMPGPIEKQNFALGTLASFGLADVYTGWQKNNEELVANRDAMLEMQTAIAELAESLQPLITKIAEVATSILTWFNDLPAGAQTAVAVFGAILGAISPVSGAISSVLDLSKKLTGGFDGIGGAASKGLGSIIPLLTGPAGIAAAIAVVAGGITYLWETNEDFRNSMMAFDDWLTGLFKKDWTESFGAMGEVVNGLMKNFENAYEAIKKILGGIIDLIAGVFTGDLERAFGGIKDIFLGLYDWITSTIKAPLNVVIGIINGVLSAVEGGVNAVIDVINKLSVTIPEWVPVVGGKTVGFDLSNVNVPKIPLLANGTVVEPNNPFLAVMGDNTREVEVVAPRSTIVGAVLDAMDMRGAAMSQSQASRSMVVEMVMDGTKFARAFIPHLRPGLTRAGVKLK